MRIISKKNATALSAISLLVGITIGTADIIGKLKNFLYPPQIKLVQEYLFLEFNSPISEYDNNKNISKAEQSARSFIQQITKQHESIKIVLNDIIISSFDDKSYESTRRFFCENADIPPEEEKECEKNEDHALPHIATYSLRNINSFPIENIEIVLAVTKNTHNTVFSYDYFLMDAEIENNCLYVNELNNKKCIARMLNDDNKTIKVDYLRPGESIVIPIYNWYAMSHKIRDDEYINEGIISIPIAFPIKVKVNGREVISQPKKMSVTPTLMLGEFEVRG